MTEKNTPIAEFVENYKNSDIIRAHMPGHKGKGDVMNSLDITEITGADSLFEADGIIAESEKTASEIFGSYKTVFSAGGSTLCIQTMLAMCLNVCGSNRVCAVRNCHRAFLSACAFLGADISWIFPEYENTLVSGNVSPESVERAITSGEKPACVYITSPDYLGRLADIDSIAQVCHKHGVILAVDNAHGAYLRFIYEDNTPMHPLFHGADICCDSAHKTLPVLTGGAYLHIKNAALERYDGYAKEIMSMFGSSSPSYLILRSLDMCNEYMKNSADHDFAEMRAASQKVKSELSPAWQIEDGECGKLVIFAPASGYYGYELSERLRERKIECEYADKSHAVMMLTGLSADEIYKIGETLKTIPQPRIIKQVPNISDLTPPERAMSIREAMLSPCEAVSIDEAAGRICARAVSCCPPGIAVIAGGEVFSDREIAILREYGFDKANVVLK